MKTLFASSEKKSSLDGSDISGEPVNSPNSEEKGDSAISDKSMGSS